MWWIWCMSNFAFFISLKNMTVPFLIYLQVLLFPREVFLSGLELLTQKDYLITKQKFYNYIFFLYFLSVYVRRTALHRVRTTWERLKSKSLTRYQHVVQNHFHVRDGPARSGRGWGSSSSLGHVSGCDRCPSV